LAEGQVNPLDEGGVEPAGETESFQVGFQFLELSPLHAILDTDDTPLAIGFLDLAVEQSGSYDPLAGASARLLTPGAEMGGEGVEVEVEAITGEHGQAAGGEGQSQKREQSSGERGRSGRGILGLAGVAAFFERLDDHIQKRLSNNRSRRASRMSDSRCIGIPCALQDGVQEVTRILQDWPGVQFAVANPC
jgi:hypothetical protein